MTLMQLGEVPKSLALMAALKIKESKSNPGYPEELLAREILAEVLPKYLEIIHLGEE